MLEKIRQKIEGQLAARTYQSETRKSWKDFRAEWEQKIGVGMDPQAREQTAIALAHFERVAKPVQMRTIQTQVIYQFIAKRRLERSRQKGSKVSPADWWRAFLTFQHMTGWRVSEPMALRWDDVSLGERHALTRQEDNQADRDSVSEQRRVS